MPVNAHPEYLAAEKEYLKAQTLEEKMEKLKRMISLAPKHKGAENLRADLKRRLKKLQEQIKKNKKTKRSSRQGIKKEELQAVIVGHTNSGKSSILATLTNAKPKISETCFTTQSPIIGMMPYEGVQIQLIENPAIESENYDKGLTHTTDTILVVATEIQEIPEILHNLKSSSAKKLVVFNKIDLYTENEKRKIRSTLQSKRYDYIIISAKTLEGLEELKEKIFKSFGKIRVYTKEPGKEKSEKPFVLPKGTKIKEIAKRIFKQKTGNIKKIKIWGPSSKFPGQEVGMDHELQDLDVVEFRTK